MIRQLDNIHNSLICKSHEHQISIGNVTNHTKDNYKPHNVLGVSEVGGKGWGGGTSVSFRFRVVRVCESVCVREAMSIHFDGPQITNM